MARTGLVAVLAATAFGVLVNGGLCRPRTTDVSASFTMETTTISETLSSIVVVETDVTETDEETGTVIETDVVETTASGTDAIETTVVETDATETTVETTAVVETTEVETIVETTAVETTEVETTAAETDAETTTVETTEVETTAVETDMVETTVTTAEITATAETSETAEPSDTTGPSLTIPTCSETQIISNPSFDDNPSGSPWRFDSDVAVSQNAPRSVPNLVLATFPFGGMPVKSLFQSLANVEAGVYLLRYHITTKTPDIGSPYVCYVTATINGVGIGRSELLTSNGPYGFTSTTGYWDVPLPLDEAQLDITIDCIGGFNAIIIGVDDVTLTRKCGLSIQ